jgi:hypothetical protein
MRSGKRVARKLTGRASEVNARTSTLTLRVVYGSSAAKQLRCFSTPRDTSTAPEKRGHAPGSLSDWKEVKTIDRSGAQVSKDPVDWARPT